MLVSLTIRIISQPERLPDAVSVEPGVIERERHRLRERIVEHSAEDRRVIEQLGIDANEHGKRMRDKVLRAEASVLLANLRTHLGAAARRSARRMTGACGAEDTTQMLALAGGATRLCSVESRARSLNPSGGEKGLGCPKYPAEDMLGRCSARADRVLAAALYPATSAVGQKRLSQWPRSLRSSQLRARR
jgi:hypothetical protein